MDSKSFIIESYRETKEAEWDCFVLENSVNGTFLQTRRFLNYHPKERFCDASYMVYDSKNHLMAVCPACAGYEDSAKTLISHQGSTFGGIIIGRKYYKAHLVIELIDALEQQMKQDGFQKIYYRITSDIFSKEKSDLLQYCLYYRGYGQYNELNLYVDLSEFQEDILSKFGLDKRRKVHGCEKAGLSVRELKTDDEIRQFYEILCETLKKYERNPVHSLSELFLLKNEILKQECGFYGAYLDNEMAAGAMMFYFHNVKAAHTQYLCAKHEYDKLSPMTYMYYAMIKEMREKSFHRLCWGTSSEHLGKELNFGLTRSKERFGSKHTVNRIYYKSI